MKLNNESWLRGVFNLFLIISIATEVYMLLTVKTNYATNGNDFPAWLKIMHIIYGAYAGGGLYLLGKWKYGAALISISLIRFFFKEDWTVLYAITDSVICLLLLTSLLAIEVLRIWFYNEKDNIDNFKLFNYKK